MAVQVWIGEKPENPNERKAIIALASGLERLDGLYIMLANFSVGGRTIDLVILKHDGIFIVELKHCDGKVFGSVNGAWTVVSRNGSVKQLNPGRKNPYNQVVSYFYSFTNFLSDHKADIVSAQKASDIDFRQAKRVVVTMPTLEAGSEVELDWKVQVKGLDELPTYLVVERCNGIELSDAALERIPKLLHCTPWQELHDLLAGVMPAWDKTPTDVIPPPLPDPVVLEAAQNPPPAPKRRWSPRHWMAGGSVLTVFVVLSLLYSIIAWPFERPTPAPAETADGNVPAITTPMPMLPTSGVAEDVNGGIFARPQSVHKNWDAAQKKWVWADPSLPRRADVVVTLESVNFNDGKITLQWTVENNRNTTLYVPLTESNIAIVDHALQYQIDPRLSDPVKGLYVKPGERAPATVVVPQPVSPSAYTLKVTLLRAPFDKTTWLVSFQ